MLVVDRADAKNLNGVLFALAAAHGACIGDKQTTRVEFKRIYSRLLQKERSTPFLPDNGRATAPAFYIKQLGIKTFRLEHVGDRWQGNSVRRAGFTVKSKCAVR